MWVVLLCLCIDCILSFDSIVRSRATSLYERESHRARFKMATQVQTATEMNHIHQSANFNPTPEITKPHDVETDIVYFKSAEDGSVATIQDIASNDTRFCDVRRVLMRDIRGKEKDFTLEEHGFQFVEHQVPEDACSSEESIKNVHYRDMENFVKDL